MNYLTLDQTLDYLRPHFPSPFDLPQLAELCRTGKLTPLFPYDRYALFLEDYQISYSPECTFYFSGYLQHPQLVSIIDGQKDIEISRAFVFDYSNAENEKIKQATADGEIFLLFNNFNPYKYKRDDNYCIFDPALDPVLINRDNLRFNLIQLSAVLENHSNIQPTSQQAARIAELEAQLAAMQDQTTRENCSPAPETYTTTAITALSHVIAEFWQEWKEGTKPTKQTTIVDWIMENYPSINRTMAERIERVARHEKAK